MLRTKRESRKRWLWIACEHRRILVGYLKLFRFRSVMMVQTKCKLNNTELFLKLFHIQSKEIGSQSNGSIGRPLGFVINKLNSSASLHGIAPCLNKINRVRLHSWRENKFWRFYSKWLLWKPATHFLLFYKTRFHCQTSISCKLFFLFCAMNLSLDT